MITGHLDYGNSLLFGLPENAIRSLHTLQNRAAKLMLNWKYRNSSTKALKCPHWLPIKYRINFKLVCIVFKCLKTDDAPVYLKDICYLSEHLTMTSHILSVGSLKLEVPFIKKKTFAARSFGVAGPTVWNDLPPNKRTVHDFINKIL